MKRAISDFHLISLILPFVLMTVVQGCISQPEAGFITAAVDELEETVPFPPTLKELQAYKSSIAFLPVQYSEGLTRYHRILSHAFVMSVLEEFGDLEVMEDIFVLKTLQRTEYRDLKQLIEEEKYRRFEKPLVDRVIKFGKRIGVRYISLMIVQTSPVKVSLNDWSTYITFRIMRVEDPPDSSYMNHEFTFVFSESNSLWEYMGTEIRGKFPLSGFILETRGNQGYARINLGRGNRIALEQDCKIFRRIRKEVMDSSKKASQVTDFDLLGKMKIFNVQQDFSWARVEPDARVKILKGDAVRCY